jgi:hypothetical protein
MDLAFDCEEDDLCHDSDDSNRESADGNDYPDEHSDDDEYGH